MNPQELSTYLTNLLRSEPEVVTSFFMGVIFAGTLAFSVRRWAMPTRDTDSEVEIAKKETEIARKDAEVIRKEAQIARNEELLAIQKGIILEHEKLIALLRPQSPTVAFGPVTQPIKSDPCESIESVRSRLEAENRQLAQEKRALEAANENLRTELAHVADELAHWAKWTGVLEEKIAELDESGELSSR